MLGQPYFMLIPEVVGMQAHRRAARRHHGHRPRAHGHPDAPEEGRGRQVRRVLRPGPVRPGARRPGHHRQHGAGVRRHHGLLPGRRRDAPLPPADRPGRGRGRAGRAVLQGAGDVPHRRRPRTPSSPPRSSSISRRSCRPGRAQAAPGPGAPLEAQAEFRRQPAEPHERQRAGRAEGAGGGAYSRWMGEGGASVTIGEGGAASTDPGRIPTRRRWSPASSTARHQPARRLGGHRRHHQLHQHLQPVGHDRRRARSPRRRSSAG